MRIDAGAREIEVVTANGGLSLIRVTDDGNGMDAADLDALRRAPRHVEARRRRPSQHLDARLPRRGPAVHRLHRASPIQSKKRGAADAFEIIIDRGTKQPLKPAGLNPGTRVEVRDLFSATPARLKFLKSERSENLAVSETVKRLAMAHPEVGFSLTMGERTSLRLPATGALADGLLAAPRPHHGPRVHGRRTRRVGASAMPSR